MAPVFSKHFSFEEFECPCCKQCIVTQELIDSLEYLRDALNKPLKITSGYRCEKHNAAIGGEANSQHCLGKAADVLCPSDLTLDLFYMSADISGKFQGIGVYPNDGYQHNNFLHLDVRDNHARWSRVHGKYVEIEKGLHYVK